MFFDEQNTLIDGGEINGEKIVVSALMINKCTISLAPRLLFCPIHLKPTPSLFSLALGTQP